MKKLLLAVVSCLCVLAGRAQETFYLADGLYYSIVDGKYAELASAQDEKGYYEGDVTVPERVTLDGTEYPVEGLGMNAFYHASLNELSLPASLRYIDEKAFYLPMAVKAVRVAGGNATYQATDGVLFDRVKGVLVYYPNRKEGRVYDIPEGTLELAAFAFCGSTLDKVDIPVSIKNIEKDAFSRAQVDTVVVHSQVPQNMSEQALPIVWGEQLIVPDGCEDIYRDAEGWSLFNNISDVSHAALPVFTVSNLRYQRISTDPDNLEVRVLGFAEEPTSRKSLAIKKNPVFEDVTYTTTEMAAYAFVMADVTSISLPNTLRSVPAGAFMLSTASSVGFGTSPVCESIGKSAFQDVQLSSLKLPASLKRIENNAFKYGLSGASPLTVTIPDELEYIAPSAFTEAWVVAFKVSDKNNHFAAEDGVLYDKTFTRVKAVPTLWEGEVLYFGENVKAIDTDIVLLNDIRLVSLSTTPPTCYSEDCFMLYYPLLYVPVESIEAYKNAPGWSYLWVKGYGDFERTVDDDIYYVYDEKDDLFLSRGSFLGVVTTMDSYGLPVNVEVDEIDGSLRMCQVDFDNGYFIAPSYVQGTEELVIASVSRNNSPMWQLIKTDKEGSYLLYNIRTQSYLASTGRKGDYCRWTDLEEDAAQLRFIKAGTDEYRDILKARPTAARLVDPTFEPVDVTDKIKNPTMSTGTSGWANGFDFTYYGTSTSRAGVSEVWNAFGTLSQRIENLEPGVYRLGLQAYFRGSTNGICAMYDAQGIDLGAAILFAGQDEARITPWAKYRVNDNNPNTMEEARVLFNKGLYQNEVWTCVGEDGKLAIGLSVPYFVNEGWLIWRNATLTYYGPMTDGINAPSDNDIKDVYTPSGMKTAGLRKGLNIVRKTDGKVLKMMVK